MKELDFLPATNQLSELMFDVELIPIETQPFQSEKYPTLPPLIIDDYFSVTNIKTRECLSVVSKGYRLIHNREALKIGKEAFSYLFPSVNTNDLIPYKVIAPKRKTFCHIDLIHKDVNFNVWEQDTWFPIIRITNSYNKTYALSFEIGFVRKLCSNGVIFNKKTITVKINHTKREQDWEIKADLDQLKALEMEFTNHMLNLKRFFLDKKYIFPLVCKALNLNYEPKETQKDLFGSTQSPYQTRIMEEGRRLKAESNNLAIQYAKTLGENAYTAFNVITDIISHQDKHKIFQNYSTNVRNLNSNLSEWIQQFTEEAEKRNFNIENYLEKELNFPIFKETA